MPMKCQAEALKNLGIDLDAEYDAITSIPYKTDLFPLKRFRLYYLKYNILPSVTVSQRIVEFME